MSPIFSLFCQAEPNSSFFLSFLLLLIISGSSRSSWLAFGDDVSVKVLRPDDISQSVIDATAAIQFDDDDIGQWQQRQTPGDISDGHFRPLVAFNISRLETQLQRTSGAEAAVVKKASACDRNCGLAYDKKPDDDDNDQEDEDRIVGGEQVTANRYPWLVELMIVVADFFKPKKMRCAATIIKNQFLLSAAHCFYHKQITSINAMIGFHYLDTETFPKTGHEIVIPVAQIFIHPRFDPVTMEHDVAVLELVKPVIFTEQIHAICLPDDKAKSPKAGTAAIVAGWGLTEAFGTFISPKMLLATNVSIVSKKQCRRIYSKSPNLVLSNSICASGPGFTSQDPCSGDSGGPLMLKTKSGGGTFRHVAVGIVSWGVGCGRPGLPGVYVRLSSYLSWIQSITATRDDCTPTVP